MDLRFNTNLIQYHMTVLTYSFHLQVWSFKWKLSREYFHFMGQLLIIILFIILFSLWIKQIKAIEQYFHEVLLILQDFTTWNFDFFCLFRTWTAIVAVNWPKQQVEFQQLFVFLSGS